MLGWTNRGAAKNETVLGTVDCGVEHNQACGKYSQLSGPFRHRGTALQLRKPTNCRVQWFFALSPEFLSAFAIIFYYLLHARRNTRQVNP